MGAAGRLDDVWSFFSVFLFLFDDGVGWVGWDVNVDVHVTLMMLR